VSTAEVVEAIDSREEWIQQRSGFKTRRFAGPEKTVPMMSVAVSSQVMERAGVDASQVDVVVVTVSHVLLDAHLGGDR
jgi:3-oxoacyl-[acyl-carrier-protein] synthase-3